MTEEKLKKGWEIRKDIRGISDELNVLNTAKASMMSNMFNIVIEFNYDRGCLPSKPVITYLSDETKTLIALAMFTELSELKNKLKEDFKNL